MEKRNFLLLVVLICLVLPALSTRFVEFGGTYQICESGECSQTCLTHNRWTGSCSCPKGYSETCFDSLSNMYGAKLCVCEGLKIHDGGYYGGAFQTDDMAECSETCRIPNKYTRSCTCPEGYVEAFGRVSVESKCTNETIGSRIITCTKPDLRSGNGNFLGTFQTDKSGTCFSPNPLTGKCSCPQDACSWLGSTSVDGAKMWSCSSSLQIAPDPKSLQGKTLFGYQGWFSTNRDKPGWRHWVRDGKELSGGNANIDVWPDLSEFGADELIPTNLHYPGGKVAGIFSSANPKTIDRHFKWMQTYGLDGIFLQRFVNEITNHADVMFDFRNNITNQIKVASAATGRVWAIEYDFSGADAKNIFNIITTDWGYLTKTLNILSSPQYLHHNGKPVVALWGFGFTGGNAAFNESSSLAVINWFKNTAGAYVIGGVPYNWRTSTADSVPNFQKVYEAYDAVNPWAVGRYGDDAAFESNYNNIASPDIPFAQQNHLGYGVIIFPGFSWANMHQDKSIFNQIPRRGGEFFLKQANTYVKHAGVQFLKIAMFDEMDEGTAMFKAASTKQDTPTEAEFLYLGLDGTPLPSDHYLCLAGDVTARNGG